MLERVAAVGGDDLEVDRSTRSLAAEVVGGDRHAAARDMAGERAEPDEMKRDGLAGVDAGFLGAQRASRTLDEECVGALRQMLDRELAVTVRAHGRADLPLVVELICLANRHPRKRRRPSIRLDDPASDHALARCERESNTRLVLSLRELDRQVV